MPKKHLKAFLMTSFLKKKKPLGISHSSIWQKTWIFLLSPKNIQVCLRIAKAVILNPWGVAENWQIGQAVSSLDSRDPVENMRKTLDLFQKKYMDIHKKPWPVLLGCSHMPWSPAMVQIKKLNPGFQSCDSKFCFDFLLPEGLNTYGKMLRLQGIFHTSLMVIGMSLKLSYS